MDSAEKLKQPRLKGLDANADAIDSGFAIAGKIAVIDGARISLEGNLAIWIDRKRRKGAFQDDADA
jgi:hypothetical protein